VQIVAGGVTAISGGQFSKPVSQIRWDALGNGRQQSRRVGCPIRWPVPKATLPAMQAFHCKLIARSEANYYLLTSTNLSEPLNQWTRVLTNSVSLRGPNNFPRSSPISQFRHQSAVLHPSGPMTLCRRLLMQDKSFRRIISQVAYPPRWRRADSARKCLERPARLGQSVRSPFRGFPAA